MKLFHRPFLLSVAMAAALTVAGPVASDDTASDVGHPQKIEGALFPGAIFKGEGVVRESHENSADGKTYTTDDVESFVSEDKRFWVGSYRSDPVSYDISAGYDVDEFFYVLKGSIILTSTDGTVVSVMPGDGVTIAKGWIGRWDSPEGYEKIYVIYDLTEPATED